MENIEEYIRKSKLAKRVQEIWNVANNIIGYSLIATVIILGVRNGYHRPRTSQSFVVLLQYISSASMYIIRYSQAEKITP